MKENVAILLFLAVICAAGVFAFHQRTPPGESVKVQNNVYRFIDSERGTVCWFAASRNGRATSISCIPTKDL